MRRGRRCATGSSSEGGSGDGLPAVRVRDAAGRRIPWLPAVVEGYRRTLDASLGHPVVHPLTGSSVDGKLLEGVDDQSLTALDAYEGPEYRRVIVQVQTSGGRPVDAYIYVPVRSRPPATP